MPSYTVLYIFMGTSVGLVFYEVGAVASRCDVAMRDWISFVQPSLDLTCITFIPWQEYKQMVFWPNWIMFSIGFLFIIAALMILGTC